MKRKSQITVFLIVGILVFFVFAFMFYFSHYFDKSKTEISKTKLKILDKDKQRFKSYIQSCLQESTKNAIFLIGAQGGAIYSTQTEGGMPYIGPPDYSYGLSVLPFKNPLIKGTDIGYDVSYGIRRQNLGTKNHPDVPDYPYGKRSLVHDPRIYSISYVSMLGKSTLVPLCDGYRIKFKKSKDSCDSNDGINKAQKNSVQEYMEDFIKNQTKACLNFKNSFNSKYNITTQSMNITVSFTENKVLSHMDYDIKVKIADTQQSLHFKQFVASFNVRLKQVHELMQHLIDKDINDIFFDFSRDAGTLSNCKGSFSKSSLCKKPGMNVFFFTNVCKSCEKAKYDKILAIQDTKSFIDGRPFIFQVAVQNRVPALDLLPSSKSRDSKKLHELGLDYYFYVKKGENVDIIIDPYAYDPDSDLAGSRNFMDSGYFYQGWKENYAGYFDNKAYYNCVHDYGKKICYRDLANFTKTHEPMKPPQPVHEWSSSAEYKKTKRKARITVSSSDFGIHNLMVKACDPEMLCDFQKLKIAVFNETFDNFYKTIKK